jgi:hypothetical protein
MTAEAIGRSPEQLSLEARSALTGKFVALEIYTPENLAPRRIEAVGDSAVDCARTLKGRGLDPLKFEFVQLRAAY